MFGDVPRQYELHLKAAGAVGFAVFCAAPVRVLNAILQFLWTCLGMAIGVGLGLGLAMHVYELLQGWHKAHEREQRAQAAAEARNRAVVDSTRLKGNLGRVQSNLLEDGSSYLSLMALAGYVVDDKVLRGQVLKGDARFWDIKYRFTDVTVDQQIGPRLLREDWPGLPDPITRELGRFVEHVMRDYISSWYGRLDGGCRFMDEQEKRKLGTPRDGRGDKESENQSNARRMVFSTLTHRSIPMLDQTYRALSAAFGSLATRAEHINVFSLALLKWTQVLAHTFKQYRHLRRVAEEKNNTERPSEVHIIREFMLAGKLHKAVTFGLDVPSLLFADAQGEECGTGTGDTEQLQSNDPTKVLEERLFQTPMLKECELDYNRVVACRLVRALLPRNDTSSNVVMALVTEIMGACVLQPLMNLWIPSFLNELIVNATTTKPAEELLSQTETPDEFPNRGPETAPNPAMAQSATVDQSSTTEVTHNMPLPKEASDTPNQGSSRRCSDDHQDMDSCSFTASPTIQVPKSVTSSRENSTDLVDDEIEDANQKVVGDSLLMISSVAISELEKHVNFEECRIARLNNRENSVNYDNPSCQEAVLRFVVVVEAVLLQGRCAYRHTKQSVDTDSYRSDLPEESLSQVLMEMTSDMVAFEKRIKKVADERDVKPLMELNSDMDFQPDQNEISTLRTLISTWMHTGQLARAISLVIDGMGNIFHPYYRDDAFLATSRTAQAFKKQIDLFEKVDIMVETMAVLASPRLDIEAESLLMSHEELGGFLGVGASSKTESRTLGLHEDFYAPSSSDLMAHHFGNASTPRFLDFHKNSALASSLRSERERRLRSWESQKGDESLHSMHRPGASSSEVELHNELHSLASTFYNGTNVLTIRDAARKSETAERDPMFPPVAASDTGKVSLVTVETVSNRRRIEVPDDDSSFLLRAQPRSLNPVSVHRDDRNHDLSYSCFLATYEEPAAINIANRNHVGRYIRRCFLQYYPIDRTATVMLHNDARKLDRRKGKPWATEQLNQQQPTPYLSGAFLRERHLCQKWTQKGSTTQNFLSSSVMEAADFNATLRSGKALDFVYRMSLFDRPMIELAGKRFTIHDSAARGHHRSDASALEVSDAALSALMCGIGKEFGHAEASSQLDNEVERSDYRHRVEMGPDGYPMIFMKFVRKFNDDAGTEIKPYRISFVRAALMITSARQEAQLQCLMDCVKAGSMKIATKARIDAQLRPTMKILEFANDRSADRLRSSALLRDLKLGVYHIDREQLRRNGLLNPRFPTTIHDFKTLVEGAVQAKDVAELFGSSRVPPTSTLYKIHCIATVELVAGDEDLNELEPYLCDDGTLANQYREEWIVYRSMKDFQTLHKHLKSEVANAESSASTSSRLVGAAAAAFSTSSQGRRNRKALIPSLAQASKTGAIAVTQKAITRRGELLGEYLEYLLSPDHTMNRSMELLLFLGASFPFPSEVRVTQVPVRLADPLGRTSFIRFIASRGSRPPTRKQLNISRGRSARPRGSDETTQLLQEGSVGADRFDDADLIESVLSKVDQVPLADVRNRLVELVKYQFGFENASFFRSRLLAALETASFVAMTKGSEFRKLLYRMHLQHFNPEAIAGLIEKVLDILWPDGCWLVPRPVLNAEEEAALQEDSRQKLHETFPDQVRTILGKDLARDGLDMFHEMLQNRLVVKSLFYMLFDLIWIELFPELRDALPCASALDIE